MMNEAVPRSGAFKWQRARVLSGNLAGRLVWVEAGPPILHGTMAHDSHVPTGTHPVFITNIRQGNLPVVSTAWLTELLPEFADDVPLISYEEWITQAATARDSEPLKDLL